MPATRPTPWQPEAGMSVAVTSHYARYRYRLEREIYDRRRDYVAP